MVPFTFAFDPRTPRRGLACMAVAVWLLLFAPALRAQNEKLPTRNNDFCMEVKTRLDKIGTPEALFLSKRFINGWVDRRFSPADLDRMAAQANKMLEEGYDLYPEVGRYLSVAAQVAAPNSSVRVPLKEYYNLIDSAYVKISNKEFRVMLQRLEPLIFSGLYARDELYRWRLQRVDAHIRFIEYTNPYTGEFLAFPGLEVSKGIFAIVRDRDSIAIEESAGRFDVLNGMYYGTKGNFAWQGVGLDTKDIYCKLGSFVASLKENGFQSDSATFFYKKVLEKPITGKLLDKAERAPKPEQSSYPLFVSYESNVKLKDVIRGADYEGGFTMRGATRFGSKTDQGPATLYIKSRKKGGQRVVRLQANEYSFRDSVLKNDINRVTVLLSDGDTMVHPRMRVVYDPFKPELQLIKDLKNPTYPQPMTSSYHKYGMYYEWMRWNPETDTMVLSSLIDQENRPGALESQDYFIQQRFAGYKALLPFNPIALLYKYELDKKAAQERAKKRRAAEAKKATETTSTDEYTVTSSDATTEAPPPTEEKKEDDPFAEDETVDEGSESGGSGDGGYIPAVDDSAASASSEFKPTVAARTAPKPSNRNIITVDKVLKAYKQTQYKRGFVDALMKMDAAGYVHYDRQEETIVIQPKLRTWARAAWKLKDFDVIQLVSKTKAPNNFLLDVKNKYIQANGVESFILSDSQMVTVRPQENYVLVGKNRDLRFGGLVYAGKLNLYGKGTDKFRFDYKGFNIKTAQLDSVKFAPRRDRNFDPNKNPRLTKALEQLKIEGVNGAVYINKPKNKSGKQVNKMYPTFDCYTNAFVFWNQSGIQKGLYDRKRLHFALDPFLLDSLENFIIDNLEFPGEFYCSDIVPAFRDTLKPVADNTYGIREYFADGIDLYKKKGRFRNELVMDGYGLHGKGEVDFLSTTALSDTFTFHFDSVMAVTKVFFMKDSTINGTFYPAIQAGQMKYKWYPQKDLLELETLKEPLIVHNGLASFRGKVRISSKGAIGSGLMVMKLAQIVSDSINLSDPQMVTRQSIFRVALANDSTKFHLEVTDAEVAADLKTNTYSFVTAEPGKAKVIFPQHKYESSLARGSYKEADAQIVLEAKYPEKKYNVLRSTDPGQAGLEFAADGARYSLGSMRISAWGVDSILVADAILYPDKDSVFIKKNGFLDQFNNARLVADTARRYHEITEATLNVQSKKQFGGTGTYPYRTIGVAKQPVALTKIGVSVDGHTFAKGVIKEDQNFFISNKIYFRDSIEIRGQDRLVGFKGFVKIQANSSFLANAWFKFAEPNVNPDSVYIPIKDPKNRAGQPLSVGVHYDGARRQFYSYFFRTKRARTDKDVLVAQGYLTWNQENREFNIGPLEKLSGKALRGQVMSYDDELNIMTSRGWLDFPYFFNADEQPTIETAGKWRHDDNNKTVITDLVMKLDIPVLPPTSAALGILHRQFNLVGLNANEIDFKERQTQESIAEFLDRNDTLTHNEPATKEFLKVVERSEGMVGMIKLAQQLPATFMFTNLKFNYSDEQRGFWCFTPVGVVGIGGRVLNKMMDSKIEYRLGRRLPSGVSVSDTCRIYLQFDDNTWVYYDIRNTEVRTVSSETQYNDAIEKEAEQNEKKNEKNKKEFMTLVKIPEAEKQQYVRRFSRYLLLKN
jgi:hypothetical protein